MCDPIQSTTQQIFALCQALNMLTRKLLYSVVYSSSGLCFCGFCFRVVGGTTMLPYLSGHPLEHRGHVPRT